MAFKEDNVLTGHHLYDTRGQARQGRISRWFLLVARRKTQLKQKPQWARPHPVSHPPAGACFLSVYATSRLLSLQSGLNAASPCHWMSLSVT